MEETQSTGSEPYGESAPPPMAAAPPPARKTDVAKPALVVAVIALALALVGMVAFPGPEGAEGALGPEGPTGDDGDDGSDGSDGAQGPTGPQGPSGPNGTACWDLNGNGTGDLLTEDINGDLVVDVLDCTGPQGLQGIQGLQGLQGDPGPQGLQGPPGTPATVLWAVVESNGTLSRGSNVVSATYQGVGDYTIRFNQDVRACVWIATLGYTGFTGVPPPGSIAVVGEFADPTGVWVSTDDMTGTATDQSFHVAIFC